jgi:hypothetical protein
LPSCRQPRLRRRSSWRAEPRGHGPSALRKQKLIRTTLWGCSNQLRQTIPSDVSVRVNACSWKASQSRNTRRARADPRHESAARPDRSATSAPRSSLSGRSAACGLVAGSPRTRSDEDGPHSR